MAITKGNAPSVQTTVGSIFWEPGAEACHAKRSTAARRTDTRCAGYDAVRARCSSMAASGTCAIPSTMT